MKTTAIGTAALLVLTGAVLWIATEPNNLNDIEYISWLDPEG